MGGCPRRRSPLRLGRARSSSSSYLPAVNEMSAADELEPTLAAGTPISSAARPLQVHPEELPHPRRQVEGGHVAGHVKQLQAEERHDVADDDHD
jgi:hypothetical protein